MKGRMTFDIETTSPQQLGQVRANVAKFLGERTTVYAESSSTVTSEFTVVGLLDGAGWAEVVEAADRGAAAEAADADEVLAVLPGRWQRVIEEIEEQAAS